MEKRKRSQVQSWGGPPPETWNDYRQGCLGTFAGGYRDIKQLSAFQHGMDTVFTLLENEFPEPYEIFANTGGRDE